jgi:hypothetical protein
MEATFLAEIKGLKISDSLGRGDRIDDSTFLTNDVDLIHKIIDKSLYPLLGKLEIDALNKAATIAYSKEEIPNNLTPEQFLITKLYLLQAFGMSVWMLLDNSINIEDGFLFYKVRGLPAISSNFIALSNSNSIAEKIDLILSRSELQKARSFLRQRMLLDKYGYSLPTTQLVKGASRISRFWYLIQSARSQSDLALKVSSFCSAFESLYATNSSELTHQLSERIAYFIAENASSRIEIFKLVKKAYTARSKIVHGDVIKESFLDELKKISLACDNMLRISLSRIFSSPELIKVFGGNSSEIDEFFLNLIFNLKQISDFSQP